MKTANNIGVLLTNIGTPSAPTVQAIRRYLGEFLSDPRVISLPQWLWWPILHGFILRTRPYQRLKDYQKIWSETGSPLLSITQEQANKLQTRFNTQANPITITFAMRYGTPSIEQGLQQLRALNINKILIFPLYPQYSAATTASTFDAVSHALTKWQTIPEIRMVNHYAFEPHYIEAILGNLKEYWQKQSQPVYLLFSFHGLPKDFITRGDPYEEQCKTTAKLVAKQLSLTPDQWSIAFQSRIGPRWLGPYTDHTLKELPRRGIKRIAVICPGFAADCLETLEEIAITNKKLFLSAGGEHFDYLPALNATDGHINALAHIVLKNIQGWDE